MNALPRAHDLLGPLAVGAVLADEAAEQRQIEACLAAAPFAVVRRAEIRGGLVPVGVRGLSRRERYAGWLAAPEIPVHPPESLRATAAEAPALAALLALQELWRDGDWLWGPTGSVGFQLVSGARAVTQASDLDLLLRAPEAISRESAQKLLRQTEGLPARVDVQVETPFGGIALAELARGGNRLMLRTSAGVRLVEDPWRAEVFA
jgi:phosphoribosyl-dephospho-CoA transferase